MDVTIFVSKLLSPKLQQVLHTIGHVIVIPELEKTYESISSHADIQVAILNDKLFIDQDSWDNLYKNNSNRLVLNGLKATIITTKLGNRYPLSVPFNGKFLDDTWIHHLEYTDKTILEFIEKQNIQCIHTNQGYTGCSLVLLPKKKGITADVGLANSLKLKGYDILTIQEGHIQLEGMSHGFIGGCCGVWNNVVYINGDLLTHPDGQQMYDFITESKLKIEDVKNQPLTDIGSILFYEGAKHE